MAGDDRKDEIRRLLRLSEDEVMARAGNRLVVCEDVNRLHARFAEDVAGDIRVANGAGEPLRLILPVGPTAQYPLLAETVNRERLNLGDCWFFFMDEYCDETGRAVPADHPLSFRGEARRLFFDRVETGLLPPPERIVFPTEENIGSVAEAIEAAGGVDTCYGGVGIHGHVAFNEPGTGVRGSGPRKVRLNDFTITINAVRAGVGGNLECFPRYAFTLGMRQVLGARRIRIYCRNGCEFDWANSVLRLALLGTPGDDYPVTYIREGDYLVVTDRATLSSPRNHL